LAVFVGCGARGAVAGAALVEAVAGEEGTITVGAEPSALLAGIESMGGIAAGMRRATGGLTSLSFSTGTTVIGINA
jgi:hypothetical protein